MCAGAGRIAGRRSCKILASPAVARHTRARQIDTPKRNYYVVDVGVGDRVLSPPRLYAKARAWFRLSAWARPVPVLETSGAAQSGPRVFRAAA